MQRLKALVRHGGYRDTPGLWLLQIKSSLSLDLPIHFLRQDSLIE